MNELTGILKSIKEKFPSSQKYIDRLYEKDEDFRMLCWDYICCLEVLKQNKHSLKEQKLIVEDYKNIIEDLEKECVEFIKG